MEDAKLRQGVHDTLRADGFRPTYQSTAVAVFTHPDYPGLHIRVGTSYVVAEQDGKERYRSLLREFDEGALSDRIEPM